MATFGPKPQPAALHLIKGNPSKLPASRLTEALRPKVDIPDCPAYLLPDAKAEWQRITPELRKLHIISQIDLVALAAYCQNYAIWVGLQKQINKVGIKGLVDVTPNGYQQVSAWYVASSKAFEQMRSTLAEFGLSPLSRARISPNVCTNVDLFEDLPEASADEELSAPPHGPDRFFTR